MQYFLHQAAQYRFFSYDSVEISCPGWELEFSPTEELWFPSWAWFKAVDIKIIFRSFL